MSKTRRHTGTQPSPGGPPSSTAHCQRRPHVSCDETERMRVRDGGERDDNGFTLNTAVSIPPSSKDDRADAYTRFKHILALLNPCCFWGFWLSDHCTLMINFEERSHRRALDAAHTC